MPAATSATTTTPRRASGGDPSTCRRRPRWRIRCSRRKRASSVRAAGAVFERGLMGDEEPRRRIGWTGRVEFSDEGGGFAYRPNEVVVAGPGAVERVNERYPGLFADAEPVFPPDIDAEGVVSMVDLFRMRGDF